jgi:hypothetical protein
MINLALVSAWPTKFDAVTLYCRSQKNYNTDYNNNDKLNGHCLVKKLTHKSKALTQVEPRLLVY